MNRQVRRKDDTGAALALGLVVVIGLGLAGLGSAALVSAGTSGSGGSSINQPLVTYDSH